MRELVLWSLFIMVCWPARGPQGGMQGTMQDEPQTWARITADQGRLSVDLKQADIQTVLANIAEQAGIAITIGSIDQRAISIRFTDMELETGLRRLLQLASLNYTILYSQGQAGTAVIKEVYVFGEGQQGEPQPSVIAESDSNENTGKNNLQAVSPSAQAPEVSAPPIEEQGPSEVIQRFQELSRRVEQGIPQGTSPAAERQGIEALGALKKAFQRLSTEPSSEP
jgi:hypothetical protein